MGALFWVTLQSLSTIFVGGTRKCCFVEPREADARFLSLKERDPRTMASQWNLLTEPGSKLVWDRHLRGRGGRAHSHSACSYMPRGARDDPLLLFRLRPEDVKPRAQKWRAEPCPETRPSMDDIMCIPSNLPNLKSIRLRWFLKQLLLAHPHIDPSTQQSRKELLDIVKGEERRLAPAPFTNIGPHFLIPQNYRAPTTTISQGSDVARLPKEATDLGHGTPTPPPPTEHTDLGHGTPTPSTPPTSIPSAATEAVNLEQDPVFSPPETVQMSQEQQQTTPLPTTPPKSEIPCEAIDTGCGSQTSESQEPAEASPLPINPECGPQQMTIPPEAVAPFAESQEPKEVSPPPLKHRLSSSYLWGRLIFSVTPKYRPFR